MAGIKIISDTVDTSKPKHVPKSKDLSKTEPRFKPPGGKPPLPIDRNYNRQG